MSSKLIKKRAGWSLYCKPLYGPKPTKPQEKYTFTKYEKIYDGYSSEMKLSEITIPENYTADDVIIRAQYGHEDDDLVLEIGVNIQVTQRNPHYETALEYYKKKLEKYHAGKVAFKEELKEWEIWCEQEKARQLQKQLSKAEKLLKQHGKLKTKEGE